MNKYVIAIDRGTTNTKAVVFDTAGTEVCVSSYACQKPVSIKADWYEQDMDLMWESTAKAIKGVFENGINPEEILGIIVTGQGNGLMPVDKNGNPSRMGILSLDSRGAGIHAGWNQDGRYMQAVQVVGMPFPAGGPLPILAWFAKNDPEGFKKIDKVLFSKDWIRYKLSGVLCTDPTDASGAGLMNLATHDYAWDVFSLLNLDAIKEKLPPIRPSHEIVGAVTHEAALATGLKEGTVVFCGAHDIAAYPFGVGTVDSHELVTAVGTWGFNIIPTKSLEGAPCAYYHTVPGYFLTGVGDGNSGGCLDIILDMFSDGEKCQVEQKHGSVYEYVEHIIESTKPSGVLFLPFMFGNVFNSLASAGFYGIKNGNTKADMLRAVYEGIVMGHYANIQIIPGKDDFTSMWLIGGGAKSKIFGQMFADITGLKVKVPKTNEITARGGALNALVGLGIYKNHEQACIPPEIKAEYKPDPELHVFYQKKFGTFCKISEKSQEIWSELNELSLHVNGA
jgi:L-xylulokinase